jgi:hypothetical protein
MKIDPELPRSNVALRSDPSGVAEVNGAEIMEIEGAVGSSIAVG